jgi:plastocyanin
LLAGVLLLAFAGVRAANAAPNAASVSIVDFAFSPGRTSINVGDSVTWTNNGQAPHSATASGGAFDTGILSAGGSASATFSSAGTFAYSCVVHPEMTGTVVVGGDSPDELPETGDEARTALPIAALTIAGFALLGGGAFAVARSRAR